MSGQTDFSNDPAHRVSMAVYELRATLADLHKLVADDQTRDHLHNELYDMNRCLVSLGQLISKVRKVNLVAAE